MSLHLGPPAERARIFSTFSGPLRSRSRTASSTESSSKGFRECLKPAVSTPVWVLLMRGLIYAVCDTAGDGPLAHTEFYPASGFQIGGGRIGATCCTVCCRWSSASFRNAEAGKRTYRKVNHPFNGY